MNAISEEHLQAWHKRPLGLFKNFKIKMLLMTKSVKNIDDNKGVTSKYL